MKAIKGLEFRYVVIVISLIAAIMGGIAGYILGHMGNNAAQNFKEVYHNDYITNVKMFIENCRQIYGEQAVTAARHLINIEGRHLGLVYRCEGMPEGVMPLISNQTMSVLYTKQFYEVK